MSGSGAVRVGATGLVRVGGVRIVIDAGGSLLCADDTKGAAAGPGRSVAPTSSKSTIPTLRSSQPRSSRYAARYGIPAANRPNISQPSSSRSPFVGPRRPVRAARSRRRPAAGRTPTSSRGTLPIRSATSRTHAGGPPRRRSRASARSTPASRRPARPPPSGCRVRRGVARARVTALHLLVGLRRPKRAMMSTAQPSSIAA